MKKDFYVTIGNEKADCRTVLPIKLLAISESDIAKRLAKTKFTYDSLVPKRFLKGKSQQSQV